MRHNSTFFKWMLILGLIDSVLMSTIMIMLYVSYNDFTVQLVGWVNRLDYFVYMVWATLFFLYTATIPSHKNKWLVKNKMKLAAGLMGANILIWIILFFLPVGIHSVENLTFYATGLAADVSLAVISIYFAATVFMTFYLRKDLSNKYASIPIILGVLIFAGLVRIFYPGITISPFVAALSNFIIILTFENPDRKILEITSAAKRATDKANKSLEQMNKTKDEFMSLASHQLRTPLTSIRGYSSMMLDEDMGELNDAQKHAMKEIESSSERMIFLVRDFLNISRIQAGNFVLTRIETNIIDLLREDIEQLQSIADDHQIKLVIKLPKDLTEIPELNIDRERIGEIMANLIDNAIFYSHAGKSVEVSLSRVNNFVEFLVIDHGIGVPEKEQSELFTKFFRASNARTARPDGTGIGLFLVQKVIKEHGGTIVFHSAQGKGSTFGFRLPVGK